ncbi:glycosyltransferase [Archangium violaceum]|uniref:glycosyltransferase n=1 Tax=Archangium violaceum TaxID=83451 RepID=UPI00193C25FF|nr:glycosyltransferase [Archangium violaceum]QRK10075.1 glycosyltransferase [Archangium violaceum]
MLAPNTTASPATVPAPAVPEPHIDRVTPPRLEDYRGIVDDPVMDDIARLAAELRGVRVAHFNTTARGGGVAVMLRALLSFAVQLGLEHYAEVIPLDERSCRFMARMADLLQGGGPGELDRAEGDAFVAGVERALRGMSRRGADVYWVHDIQLVPMAQLLPSLRPAVWFSHLDTAHPEPRAADFIRGFLEPYVLNVNNTPWSAFMEGGHPFATFTLGIDAFGRKNRPMSAEEGAAVLRRCGIDVTRPLVAQVSRFGRWKNPWQAVDIHRELKRRVPGVQLALVGAMEATDDVEAARVLEEVRAHAAGDPDVHLLWDPERVGPDEVNAAQRHAHVVLQRSSREGFGFTVTEAMWKGQPVVGTSATGVRYQLEHGRTGFIADDTHEAAEHAARLISDRAFHARMGAAAQQHVRNHFLLPVMVRDYLALVHRVVRGA